MSISRNVSGDVFVDEARPVGWPLAAGMVFWFIMAMMRIIPAIDLRGGRCVRLRQGDYAQETVFSGDPVAVARRWVEEGAAYLHLVDLDGAREGRPVNTAVIAQIVAKAGVGCELGGGLRTDEAIDAALSLGVDRVIVGTRALADPEWFRAAASARPGKLVLGLDARGGKVATDGWIKASDCLAVEVVEWYQMLPLAAVVYTDISKDGMLAGPNYEATQLLSQKCRHPVIASGGIATIEHVLELARRGVGACILGRSLYEGTIKLPELIQRLQSSATART